jgi:hypothetical protein
MILINATENMYSPPEIECTGIPPGATVWAWLKRRMLRVNFRLIRPDQRWFDDKTACEVG